MNILEKYEALVEQEKWNEALPVIEEIVERAPQVATSWFNHGVCLSALGREGEAADKFLKAYEIDPSDFGAQYRAFRSLFFARDYLRFLEFAKQESETDPDMIEHFLKDEHFSTLFTRPEFQQLRRDCEDEG
jgi:tetratricopeptide (TPR) repeat protein